MNVRIQFFSRLRAIGGDAELNRELPEGATVSAAFTQLEAEFPKLRDWEGKLLFAVGVEFASCEDVLREGDLLSLMPPVQGG